MRLLSVLQSFRGEELASLLHHMLATSINVLCAWPLGKLIYMLTLLLHQISFPLWRWTLKRTYLCGNHHSPSNEFMYVSRHCLTLTSNNQAIGWKDVLGQYTSWGPQWWILGGSGVFIRWYCIKTTCFHTWVAIGYISRCCMGIHWKGDLYISSMSGWINYHRLGLNPKLVGLGA